MARPTSRRRTARQEEDEEPRGRDRARGKGGNRAPGPNPATMVMAGVIGVLILIVGVVILNRGDKPKATPEPLGPATQEAPKPKTPAGKEPPKPLTAAETSEVEALFDAASEEMEKFRVCAAKGWSLKTDEDDEEGANTQWLQAKKHYMTALRTVNEVMEDEERFPEERQQMYMKRWIEQLGGWSKEASSIGKVHSK